MAIRFRAHLRFTVGSGMASWVNGQMLNRLEQAFHVREGQPDAERSRVTLDVVAGVREDIYIDVFWPDDRDDLAVDTRATFEAVLPWVRPDDPGPDPEERSWMNWHRCEHDQEPPVPCPPAEWRWPT